MKYLLVILNLFLLIPFGVSQQSYQVVIDSLITEYQASDDSMHQVDLLNKVSIAYFSTDDRRLKDSVQKYSLLAIDLGKKINYKQGLAKAYYLLGKQQIGVFNNPAKGTQYLLSSLEAYQSIDDVSGISNCYMQLGLISYMLQYYTDALRNLKLSLETKENAVSMYLTALSYTELDSFELAKEYFSKSISAYGNSNDSTRLLECYLYLGRLHLKTKDFDSAFHYMNLTIQGRLREGDPTSLLRPYAFISEYYLELKDIEKAIFYGEKCIELEKGKTKGNKDEISLIQAAEVLSEAYAQKKDFEKAHYYLKLYDGLSAELSKGSLKQKVADMQSMFEFEQEMNVQKVRQQKDKEIAEAQISQERIIRNAILIGACLLFLLLVLLYSRYTLKKNSNLALQEKNEIISAEKKRSEDLLLNILPYDVAEELKAKGEADAKLIDQATVIFTDFKGFTQMSEKLSPKELVADIHECFSAFDAIMEKYNIEKIKTIGDSYMAAGGLPAPNETHAKDVVKAAFEIRDFIEAGKLKKIEQNLPYFEIRIGIHTGPIVAGIVGVKKFQYDIWGDTVNMASRMESAGEVGKVNISQSTYDLLKDDPQFVFESRGKIEAKGKGEVEMVFVSLKK